MRKENLVSIIVPIYNAGRYIDKCIESIIGQTYSDIEILLIDDGSNDNSYEICNRWREIDKRILVIHKQNGGVSSARNVGLEKANGEYIVFVDADDWLEREFISTMVSKIGNSDFVIGGYKIVGNGTIGKKFVKESSVSSYEFRKQYDCYLGKDLINPPFAKLFKKEIIENQHFDEKLSLGEDLAFNLKYLEKCSRVNFISDLLYNYNVYNESSASKKLRDNDFEQVYKIYLLSKKFVGKENVIDFDEIDKRYCENVIGLLQLLLYSDNPKKNNIAKEWISSEVFQKCCKGKYKFGIVNKIPQYLCRHSLYKSVIFFYKLKKAMRN